MNFADILTEKIKEKQCPVCVGLSPDWDRIPEELKKKFNSSGAVLFIFNKAIIDALCDTIPAIMLDFTSYLRYGIGGMVSFKSTVDYARKKGLAVISDLSAAGNMKMLSEAFLTSPTEDLPDQLKDGAFDTDALTADFYGLCGILDPDAMFAPFRGKEREGRGIFAVYREGCLSNKELVRNVSESASRYKGDSGFADVGLYVKTDSMRTAASIRKELPDVFMIADNSSFADVYFTRGTGALIVCKDNILYAYQNRKWAEKYGEKGFADAARAETAEINDRIGDMI